MTYVSDGKVETLRYSMLTPMFLNQLQEQASENQRQARQRNHKTDRRFEYRLLQQRVTANRCEPLQPGVVITPTKYRLLPNAAMIGVCKEGRMLLADLATLATALFTGAAVYITLVEHPARLSCSTQIAVAQWRPSYHRATLMQASLAIVGAVLAIAAWLHGEGRVWLSASLILGAVVPFTLGVMWPTNKRIENEGLDISSEVARNLLIRWGNLHAARSVLSVTALILMIFVRR